MGLELMPDGVTFKKLNATQEKAVNRYYKRLHDKPITQDLALPIGLVVLGGIGALAYIFKDKIEKEFEEQQEAFATWIAALPKKIVVASGGGVADVILTLTDNLFGNNPNNPEYMTLYNPTRQVGPFTRCQRWESDGLDWRNKVDSGGFLTKTGAALAAGRIIKNMKRESCSRPAVFSQAQWDEI